MPIDERFEQLPDMLRDAIADGATTKHQMRAWIKKNHDWDLDTTSINQILYKYEGRFFLHDKDPKEGLPGWRLMRPWT